MGIDYLIIVLSLVTFLGFLSLSFIYFPFKKAWGFLQQHYKKIITPLPLVHPTKVRSEPSLYNTGLKSLRLAQSSRKKAVVKPVSNTRPPQSEFTVLYVIADVPNTYNGYTLWQTLIDQNLVYGDSQIFHAYEKGKVQSILFSVAGAIEPGYFEIEHIASIRLPGLCLFMHNNATPHPLDTFEYMLEVAKKLAKQLGGTVCDNKRHILSEAMIETYQSQLSLLPHQE